MKMTVEIACSCGMVELRRVSAPGLYPHKVTFSIKEFCIGEHRDHTLTIKEMPPVWERLQR